MLEENACPDEKDTGHSVLTLDLPAPNQKDKYKETMNVHPPASLPIEPDKEENEATPNLARPR